MRTLLCLGVALALTTVVAAEDRPEKDKDAKHKTGKVVRVDADGSMIVVRDENNKEHELKVNASTKFMCEERKPLTEGLKAKQFKEGAQIWFRLGTDANEKTITELKCFDPASPEKKDPG